MSHASYRRLPHRSYNRMRYAIKNVNPAWPSLGSCHASAYYIFLQDICWSYLAILAVMCVPMFSVLHR